MTISEWVNVSVTLDEPSVRCNACGIVLSADHIGHICYPFERQMLEARVRELEQSLDPRTAIHEAIAAGYLDAGSIPWHLLAGTEPPGLSCGYVVAPEAITRGDFVRVPPNEPTRLDARTALAIGTRVRVDDKASSMHDREGVVQAYGPGGEVEVVLDGWPGAHGFHRAQLALVDDTLPECDACHGTGSVALFSSLAECHACGGSGVVS